MSKDVQFFGACNHIVNNIHYENDLCPRCYGKGYYIDIFFDLTGQAILTSESIKLQQEILKIMLDEKYSNVFHKDWGSELSSMLVGTKNLKISQTKLELIIRNALDILKTVQMNENEKWAHMTAAEMLDKVEYIEVTALGKTGYYVEVLISNSIGEIMTQSVVL